jgi:TonB family protein
MTPAGNRFRRRSRGRGTEDIRFGRMLTISVVIHGLVVLLTVVTWRPALLLPPVTETYRVELVYLPVAAPQRGRPTSAEVTAPEQPTPPTKTPATKTVSPVPTRKVLTKAPVKKAPPPDKAYDAAQDAIERMQRKQEIAELKKRLKTLAKDDPRQPASTPVTTPGTDTGKGKDPGGAYETYIRQFLKEAWTLSRYQVTNLKLWAEVELTFDPRGTLKGYHFLRRSGEARFDESVQRAVLDLRQLPTAPGQPFTLKVTFNLKELLNK